MFKNLCRTCDDMTTRRLCTALYFYSHLAVTT